jgi:alanyl-tRNA synthetase
MGFERLVRVLQNKNSNYDTDIFTGTIKKVEEITGKKYSGGDDKPDIAFRVLADHIRAISFTIADGQLPSNTGAGYVIRRILRRAVRYYYSYLDYQQPLLFQLVPVLARQFENVFPELYKQEQFVSKVIREEEESFLRTLEKGLKRIDDIINSYQKHIAGQEAFELYDTYGFPLDLTKLIASENGLTVDEEAFNIEMQKQKQRSRAASTIDTGDWIIVNEEESNSHFVGYDTLETEAIVLKYRKVKTKGKDLYQIVLDRTPFYAESGGQVGDTGQLAIGNTQVAIVDTKKENDLIVHFAENLPADISGEVIAKVDADKRKKIAVHHSATHLLHAALRKVLGTHVAQKGSLVNADYLRFDFSHFSKMSDEEIKQVEELVNQKIRENIPVVIRQMPKEEAMQTGAMALFGEKYGDTVRVVTIDPSSAFGTFSHGRRETEKNPFSIELCGGTHVGSTGDLGFFKITSEGAVAAGVRRIEAVSGLAAEKYAQEQFNLIHFIRDYLKNPKDITKAITSLNEENTALKKQVEKFENAQLKSLREELLQKVQKINSANFIGEIVDVSSADALKKLAFELKPYLTGYIIVLASAIDNKAQVVLLFDEGITAEKNLDAAATIKQKIAPLIKGGGGGQKTLATAGGQNAAELEQVIKAVKDLL